MAVSVSVRGYAQVRVCHGVVSQVGASGCPLQGCAERSREWCADGWVLFVVSAGQSRVVPGAEVRHATTCHSPSRCLWARTG